MKKILTFVALISALSMLCSSAIAATFNYNYSVSSSALDDANYSVALDGDGNLHAVYVIGGQVKYRRNLDNEETVTSGSSPRVTIDPVAGLPVITSVSGGSVSYSWKNSGGIWQTVAVGDGNLPDVAVDRSGIVHLVYLNDDDSDAINELFYTSGYGYGSTEVFASSTKVSDGAYCNNLSCRVTDNYTNPNIKVDSNNNYQIIALEQYRNNTLVPNYQDYLDYFGLGVNSQDGGHAADSLSLRRQFLSSGEANSLVAVITNGSDLKTITFDPSGSLWMEQSLNITGTNPSLYKISGLDSLAYEDSDLVKYQERSSSDWSEAQSVATGTMPSVLANSFRYVYYLDGGRLYLTSDHEVPDVSAPAVSFLSKPDQTTTSTGANFSIGGSDVVAYKYKLDNGEYGSEILIANQINLSGLSVGQHTISALGRDLSGNWQSTSSPSSYTWTITAPSSTSGGGGGGGGSTGTTTPIIEGRVLGANTFQFKRILRAGMSGVDVMELQKLLKQENFLKIKTLTKYFGPATQKALIAWKKKHKIRPATGVLSKPNISYLNRLINQI